MRRLALPLGIVLSLATIARADYNPVALKPSSFNQDMIVENPGPTPIIYGAVTTASMDGGINNDGDTWNEQGYFLQNAAVGVPPAGSTFQATWDPTGHSYTMAPSYTANNAILLDVTYFTNADFRLATPSTYRGLSFLTSGGNGGCTFRWTVQRQDGTSDTGTGASPDWFFVDVNRAWTANGRVNAQWYTLDNYNSDNPRLYSVDVSIPASSSPITNINIKYVSGNASGHSCIMAISGQTSPSGPFNPILGTGYNADIVVEATAPRLWLTDYEPPATLPVTATMDKGTNMDRTTWAEDGAETWFEQGYYVRSNVFGLPHPGTTFASVSQPDHFYTMAPDYAVNNATFIDESNTTATIALATPAAYSALSFLGSSGGGACQAQLVVNFDDSTTETHGITIPDWFGGSPTAWVANGRIDCNWGTLDNIDSGDPRLYSVDVVLVNTAKLISSLGLTYTSGGRGAIFALSATAGAVAPLITNQPVSLTVSPGAPASFTVGASGTQPISFQWQKGTNGMFADLTGQTAQTLSFPSAADANDADYRVIAANTAGRATSVVATLTVLSSLPRITAPTDPIVAYQPLGGGSPSAEGVVHAIDRYTQKYLNSGNGATPMVVPVGFIVTPQAGRTFLGAVRFYTANDAPERDPANYVIEGSNDSGTTWSLIASNLLSLPDGRNASPTATTPIDATTNYLRQVRLVNNTSYAAYRVYCTSVKGSTYMMQIGEVEMLGTADTTGYPVITTQPTNTTAYAGSTVSFSVAALGTPAPTFHWFRNNLPLTDGGNVSGSSTATLTLSSLAFADAADFKVVAANSLSSVTSAVAHLTVISTLQDVTQGAAFDTDPITAFGDTAGTFWGDATNVTRCIDNGYTVYRNGGSGFSAPAGFPPFVGPVGVIITPRVGSTKLNGLRIYTADGDPERDPADFALAGSNNDGASWTPIAAGALALPNARNDASSIMDPLTGAMQEVLFANETTYTSYKLTFVNTKTNATAACLQLAELELLGVAGVNLGFSPLSGGQFQLNWTQGTLLEATSLSGPWQTNSATPPLIITPSGPQKFYRLILQ